MSRKTSKKSKKTENYITERIEVQKIIPGGQALATLKNGKKILLWNALPGEVVSKVRVTKEKSNFVEGVAEEIAEKSKNRIAPKDACYLATSPWQIMSEAYEDEQKVEILREIFRQHDVKIPGKLQDFHIAGDGNYYHYRNKMEYALYYSHEDEKIHLAFHERGSHRKIPVEQSSLEVPEIWQRATEIVDELNRKGEDARKYQSIILRSGEPPRTGENIYGLPIDPAKNRPKITVSGGLLENGKPHPKFPSLSDIIGARYYTFSPGGFFQINVPVYNWVIGEIMCQGIYTKKVLDLYAGVGTIGLSVARAYGLTLVECDQNAHTEMVNNVKAIISEYAGSDIFHIQPILAKSEDALDYVEHDQTVIVDPPRAGCIPEVIARFLAVAPERIIYLSCNPATQARDVKKLLAKYQISFFQPYNFFPRTPHIENLIILDRKGSASAKIAGSAIKNQNTSSQEANGSK